MNGDPPGGPYTHNTDMNVPDCSDGQGQTASGPVDVPNAFFNRQATVDWALSHAQDEQTVSAMCTWFVSNALWAGGFPKSAEWTDAGSHGRVQRRPGTVDAWSVVDFMNYLSQNYDVTPISLGLLSDQNNAVPQAEPGDIIAYDWGQGEGISHLALVVSISDGQYPNVAEWGQADWVLPFHRYTSPYSSRGWTWSEKHQQWLQEVLGGNVTAYLLHINGGVQVGTF